MTDRNRIDEEVLKMVEVLSQKEEVNFILRQHLSYFAEVHSIEYRPPLERGNLLRLLRWIPE